MSRPKNKTWVESSGGVPEIVGAIAQVDSLLDGDTKKYVKKYGCSIGGLKRFFDYVVKTVRYKQDGEVSTIRFPEKALRDKIGDCKTLSILIGSYLKDCGLNYFYRFTYTDKSNPLAWHVYPVVIMDGKNVYMDAVIKEFNREHPYISKYDYHPRKIVGVSGVGATKKRVPKRNVIDPYKWSIAEQKAVLLFDQAEIINSQEPTEESVKTALMLKSALFDGINSPDGRKALNEIPISSVRNTILSASKEGSIPKRAGVSDPLIDVEDCEAIAEQLVDEDLYDYFSGGDYDVNIIRQIEDRYSDYLADCSKDQRWKIILNNHLENSAHHLLYEYVNNPNSVPGTVTTKTVLQRGAVDTLADIAGVNRSVMRLWLRNGVLRKNATNGAGALQPEQSIEAVEQASRRGVSLPVPVVVAVISAISTALTGTIALIAQMKAQEKARLRAAAATIGQQNFGPMVDDWYTSQEYQQQQEAQIEENKKLTALLPVAAGAAIYFLT